MSMMLQKSFIMGQEPQQQQQEVVIHEMRKMSRRAFKKGKCLRSSLFGNDEESKGFIRSVQEREKRWHCCSALVKLSPAVQRFGYRRCRTRRVIYLHGVVVIEGTTEEKKKKKKEPLHLTFLLGRLVWGPVVLYLKVQRVLTAGYGHRCYSLKEEKKEQTHYVDSRWFITQSTKGMWADKMRWTTVWFSSSSSVGRCCCLTAGSSSPTMRSGPFGASRTCSTCGRAAPHAKGRSAGAGQSRWNATTLRSFIRRRSSSLTDHYTFTLWAEASHPFRNPQGITLIHVRSDPSLNM